MTTESEQPFAATEPCLAFLQESYESGHLVGTLTGLEQGFAQMPLFSELVREPSVSEHLNASNEIEPLASRLFLRYRGRLLEMVLQRQVDQYLTYLSHLLALLFRSRPETLRAGPPSRGEREAIPLDEVLQFGTMEELLERVVERRVQNLSYKGMADLSSYLEERLGFRLFPSGEHRWMALLVVEIRNLIAHNRGIVNDTFLSRVDESPWTLGTRIVLDFETHRSLMGFFDGSVSDIDARAIEKWCLPTVDVLWPDGEPPRLVAS